MLKAKLYLNAYTYLNSLRVLARNAQLGSLGPN